MKKLMMLLVLFIQYLYSAQKEELIQLAEKNFYEVVKRVKEKLNEPNITKEDLLKAQSELFEAEERLVDTKRQ